MVFSCYNYQVLSGKLEQRATARYREAPLLGNRQGFTNCNKLEMLVALLLFGGGMGVIQDPRKIGYKVSIDLAATAKKNPLRLSLALITTGQTLSWATRWKTLS